jgi:hypothetical protein
MAFPILAAIGAATALYSAVAGKKSADKQADAIKQSAQTERDAQIELARPYSEAASFALPKMRSILMSQIAPTIGKENPYLASAHKLNTGNILRSKQGMLETSKRFWGASGNSGRGRGEALRIEQNATDAENQENLAYGETQQNYKDANTNRFLQGLTSLAGYGTMGLQTASRGIATAADGEMAAANIRGAGRQSFFGDIGLLAGIPIGDYLAEQDWARMRSLQQNSSGSSGSNRSGDAGVSGGTRTLLGGKRILRSFAEDYNNWRN